MATKGPAVPFDLQNDTWMRIHPVSPHIFHVRLNESGTFSESALARYGIVQQIDTQCEFVQETTEESVTIRTSQAVFRVSRRDGSFIMRGENSNVLIRTSVAPWCNKTAGFGLQFPLFDGELLYGLGDTSRTGIQRRGLKVQMWVKNYLAYAPAPFVISSRGWGHGQYDLEAHDRPGA